MTKLKTKEVYTGIYKTVVLISTCEKIIINHYNENEMKTPMHMSFGDENCVAGVVECLRNETFFLGYYRSHSLYLAASRDPYSFFAELMGKKTGSNGGIAGSMHMSSIKHGLLNQSAIVSSTLPLSLGAALANKTLKEKKFTTVFFGDGAIEEGVFHETLNMASLFKLPILFVCLDNDLAVDLNKNLRHGFKSIKKLVQAYNCDYLHINNPNGIEAYKITEKAKKIILQKNRPVFLHMEYYRYLQHIGITNDFEVTNNTFEKQNYRSKKTHKRFLKNLPVNMIFNEMLNQKFEKLILEEIKEEILNFSKKAFQKARDDEFNDINDIHNKVI